MQYLLTPSAGKRLIAKAITEKLLQSNTLQSGTIVIIAGTTNGYIAEELLQRTDQSEGFSRKNFFRGITTPPTIKTTKAGRLNEEAFPGDVILEKGQWQKGKTIFDYVDNLKESDILIKGANCVDYINGKAGILIGHPKGGTIIAALQAHIGKRTRLLLPVGLEKRISDNIDTIATELNSTGCGGYRLLPVTGEIFTEIEAIHELSGATAKLISAGGVCGAEGGIWLNITGTVTTIQKAKSILDEIATEPPFVL